MAVLFIICVVGYLVYSLVQDSIHTSRRNQIARENDKVINESIEQHKRIYGDFNKK